MRSCAGFLSLIVLALAGCGSAPAYDPRGVAPIGTGPAFRPGSLSPAVAAARPVAGLECGSRASASAWVHVELFAQGKVLIVPAGIGVAPPRVRDGAYVRGGRCRYPLFTDEPTGLIGVDRPGMTLGDLFAVWDRPLGRERLADFRAPVRVHVDGRQWTGHPANVPLRHHAQIVVQAGGPAVAPHAHYTFPRNR